MRGPEKTCGPLSGENRDNINTSTATGYAPDEHKAAARPAQAAMTQARLCYWNVAGAT